MRYRLIPIVASLLLLALPAAAQMNFGAGGAPKIAATAIPACSQVTISDYIVVDATSASSCTDGGADLYAALNYCVCNKDTFEWDVLASTLASSTLEADLASTTAGEGASKIGVQDASGNFVGTDLETVLLELHTLAQAGGGGGATNLGASAGATTVTITSDTGTNATIPAATVATAGAMTSVDKSKLDGIASGATAFAPDTDPEVNHSGFDAAVAGTPAVAANTAKVASDDDLSDNTTTDLAEGTNLYHTNARVDARIAAVQPAGHAASHADGAVDQILIEGLPATSVDTALVLKPDGLGGVEFGADVGGNFTPDADPAADHSGFNASVDARIGSVAPSAHASRHESGGADEVTVEDLRSDAVNTAFVLKPDGLGGVAFGVDLGGNLGTTVEPTQVTVTNTAGSNAVLPAAGAGTAGVMTGAQEAKLAGIEDNATADQTSAEILSAWETESGRDASVDGSKLDGIESGAAADQSAAEVAFSPSGTGLVAADVQAALAELAGRDAVDRDGNGLYEFAHADQDWDGDGTTWQTCDCGGGTTPGFTADWICGTYRTSATDDTPVDYSSDDGAGNPAECRFEGERVWDDITDDFAALENQLDIGATVLFPAGTYPEKGASLADNTLCWNSTSQAYDQQCAFDNASGTVRKSAVLARKDSMTLYASGADSSGEMDLRRGGTWMLKNLGSRNAWTAVSGGTTMPATFCIGYSRSQLSGFCGLSIADPAETADILLNIEMGQCVDAGPDGACDSDGTTPRLDGNFDTAETLCVDDSSSFATNRMTPGSLHLVSLQNANGNIARIYARVESVGAACGSGSEGLLVTMGGVPRLNDLGESGWAQEMPLQVYGSQSGDATEAASAGSILGPISEDRIVSGVVVTGFTFAHHNYQGEGTCTSGSEAACDEGPLITLGGGFNHLIEGNAFVHTNSAYGSGGVVNVEPAVVNLSIKRNVFRYSTGSAVMDVSSSTNVEDNLFADNLVNNTTNIAGATANSYLVRVQGSFYRFLRNRFERNFVLGSLTTTVGSGIVELAGPVGEFSGNTMLTTPNNCVVVTPGARIITIRDNVFSCGDLSSSDNFMTGFPIALRPDANRRTPMEGIEIRGNHFLTGGRVTGLADTPPLLSEAKILIREGTLNSITGEIGELGINIRDNYSVGASPSAMFVAVRGTDDPDNSRIYLDGNTVTQGKLAGSLALPPGGAIFDLDIGSNGGTAGDGIGLVTCGVNNVGGVWSRARASECAAAW